MAIYQQAVKMKTQLKLVHAEASEVFVSTIELFNGFGYKEHRLLKRVIENHIDDFKDAGDLKVAYTDATLSSTGQREQTYHLNEEQFTLLCLLVKNSPNAVKIKKAIAKEFVALRNYLPQRNVAIKLKRAAHFPMMDALKESRLDQGKETREDNYMCESKLCNFVVLGRFIGVNAIGGEDVLTNEQVIMLDKVRKLNESLLLLGMDYAERKKRLVEYGIKYRTKLIGNAVG